MKKLIAQISQIGILPTDDDNTILRKQFLVYQGLAMGMGGLLWGALAIAFNFYWTSVIPFAYTVITIINFYFLHRTKNFVVCRDIQTAISLFLPFMLQWFLGGFAISGGVMFWAILALTSSASYQNARPAIFWFITFVVLTLGSLLFDGFFIANYNMNVPAFVSLVFLVVNILCVSGIVFAMVLYFSTMNASNMGKLKQTYTKLINAEKLAALGQIAASVAHEVNTPLGAIKSSAEESVQAFNDRLISFMWLASNLDGPTKDMFVEFVATSNPQTLTLSTKEEREKKKILCNKLESLNIQNARFISDRLVQVGIYEVSPQMEKLAPIPEFEKLMMIAYNILNQQKSNQTILMAVEKASRVVKALKTYLHTAGAEVTELVNLRDNIETVLSIYNNRLKQGVVVIKNYEEVPQVFVHPDQMNQVWTNLIINAVQAMNNKGTLTIGLKKEGEFVVVSIKDTGIGIPKEIQQKIFDPFFTTKVSGEGSGLGLDIIKHILDDHSAKISFESTVGIGTTFFVRLPISKTS